MKKFTALILTAIIAMSLAACAPASQTPASAAPAASTAPAATAAPAASDAAAATEAPAAPAEVNLSADGLYPAKTIKIGVVLFDPADGQWLGVKKYFDYLDKEFNVDFVYSEAISTAEGEMAFIESCAAAGCNSIMGYYNIARNESIQLAIDKGMYYFGVAEEDVVYDAFKGNDHYLGGYYSPTMDYDIGYYGAKALIDAGSTKLGYTAGGRDFGIKMFIDRAAGFDAALAEAGLTKVFDVSGWPGTDEFSSAQAAAMEKDFDGIVCSFGVGIWLQPLATSGKIATTKLSGPDALDGAFADLYKGGIVMGTSIQPSAIFGMIVPMTIEAVNGNLLRDKDGNAPRVPTEILFIDNAEEYDEYFKIESDGTWIVNAEDMKSVMKELNPSATYDDLAKLYVSITIPEIMARREAQK